VFSGEDYAYWKVRMRAFLQSMGADVWEIITNQLYEVLAVRTTPLQVTQHEANAKAVNVLFASVSRAEFRCQLLVRRRSYRGEEANKFRQQPEARQLGSLNARNMRN
jgi:hypothetical protein